MPLPFITERLLQFIWQFQYFNKDGLKTVDGNRLQILNVGALNKNQGPDFLNARIKINDTHWAGNIELHIKTSDYLLHKHDADINYKNIILHVVWMHDDDSLMHIPTLELQPLVSSVMLHKYASLESNQNFIPCAEMLPALSALGWMKWKERLLIERLEMRTNHISELLTLSANHWEAVFWWLLAKNFGYKVNAELFEAMAQSVPVNVLAKHKHQQIQLEALLMGQANLLKPSYEDDYAKLLYREHSFLTKKYSLKQTAVQPLFLRMRPANFPTIRLSQLAALIYKSTHLFSQILHAEKLSTVKQLFDVSANDYWHYHYRFDELTPYKPKQLGEDMIHNIIINTIVPVVFAYGKVNDVGSLKTKALEWLQQIPAESNHIITNWKKYILVNAAFDSQAVLQLKKNYCKEKRCLECAAGNAILKNNTYQLNSSST